MDFLRRFRIGSGFNRTVVVLRKPGWRLRLSGFSPKSAVSTASTYAKTTKSLVFVEVKTRSSEDGPARRLKWRPTSGARAYTRVRFNRDLDLMVIAT
jgi:hypothetical protein